jgi:hypothetical protein
MLLELRSILTVVLCWLLVLTPALAAQQNPTPRPPYSAPVPQQLLHAHTVFIANGGGSNYFEYFSGGASRAYNIFYKDLRRTGQFDLVSSPSQADLIFEISAIAPSYSQDDTTFYNPQVILTVRDPHTTAILWRESANVRAYSRKLRMRNHQFDQAVAVLVNKLAVVTGQPLNQAQLEAISQNSNANWKMPTSEKVFLYSSLAAGAAILALGIHAMMNQPKLNPPATPTLPGIP